MLTSGNLNSSEGIVYLMNSEFLGTIKYSFPAMWVIDFGEDRQALLRVVSGVNEPVRLITSELDSSCAIYLIRLLLSDES